MSTDNVVDYEPGDILFKENDSADCVYIIKTGQVAIYKKAGESMLPIALIGSGEFLGEMSLITDGFRSTTAKALTPVKAVKMTKSAFKTNLAKSAPWVQALIKGLVTRLYKMDELVKKHGLVDEKAQQSIENIEKKFKKDGAA